MTPLRGIAASPRTAERVTGRALGTYVPAMVARHVAGIAPIALDPAAKPGTAGPGTGPVRWLTNAPVPARSAAPIALATVRATAVRVTTVAKAPGPAAVITAHVVARRVAGTAPRRPVNAVPTRDARVDVTRTVTAAPTRASARPRGEAVLADRSVARRAARPAPAATTITAPLARIPIAMRQNTPVIAELLAPRARSGRPAARPVVPDELAAWNRLFA